MLQTLSKFWKSLCEEGIRLPFAFDPESQQPSVTLMFYWIASGLSIASLVLLHLNYVALSATGMSLLFVLISFVMYRLRKLDKVKIDVKNESIDLEDNKEDEPNNKEKE